MKLHQQEKYNKKVICVAEIHFQTLSTQNYIVNCWDSLVV